MNGLELGLTVKTYNKIITVICKDGGIFRGKLVDWTSEDNNEPDGESITITMKTVPYLEIYTEDIEKIIVED